MQQALLPDETELMWELTKNASVLEHKLTNSFFIKLLTYKRATDKVGVRKVSKNCKSRTEAENDAWAFRLNYESEKSEELLKSHQLELEANNGNPLNDELVPKPMEQHLQKRRASLSGRQGNASSLTLHLQSCATTVVSQVMIT